MTENDKIQIRVDLKGDLAMKFEALKKETGIESNADVVRNLISDAFKKIMTEKVEA